MNQREYSGSSKFIFMCNINKYVTRILNGMCVCTYNICTAAVRDRQFIILILYNQLGVYFYARYYSKTWQ